jgi:uncharacterized protein YbjT (DUF2867 family)
LQYIFIKNCGDSLKKIMLAGATGYLGGFILKELLRRNYQTKIIVRNPEKIDQELKDNSLLEIVNAQVTRPDTIADCCKGVDVVISTVGITKQKDGLTYMDVDYQANKNLLSEAVKSGVRKIIYVSVLDGNKLKHLKICEAKEKFVEELQNSGLDYCVIRPNGFFSDISEFFRMAEKGRVFLFDHGKFKSNPIHGKDLADVCIDSIENDLKEIKVGGPEILTQNEIAYTAFKVLNKKPKITYITEWIRKLIIALIRTFTGSKTYGPLEFFLTVLAMDFVAPEYGRHTIYEYFSELKG